MARHLFIQFIIGYLDWLIWLILFDNEAWQSQVVHPREPAQELALQAVQERKRPQEKSAS